MRTVRKMRKKHKRTENKIKLQHKFNADALESRRRDGRITEKKTELEAFEVVLERKKERREREMERETTDSSDTYWW